MWIQIGFNSVFAFASVKNTELRKNWLKVITYAEFDFRTFKFVVISNLFYIQMNIEYKNDTIFKWAQRLTLNCYIGITKYSESEFRIFVWVFILRVKRGELIGREANKPKARTVN